jgi:hypothetical protein
MSADETDSIYEQLLKRYREKGFLTPEAALDGQITYLIQKGRTRKEAIKELSSSDTPWTYSSDERLSVDQRRRETKEKTPSVTTHERTPTSDSTDSARETRDIFGASSTGGAEEQGVSRLRLLRKYFIHGIAFSLLFLVLSLMWTVVFALLIGFGFLIGLILGFALLFLIIGYLNSEITKLLWFDVKTETLSLLVHGVVLFLALLPIDLVFIGIYLVFPNPLFLVVRFLLQTIPYGFVAKKVAGLWGAEV